MRLSREVYERGIPFRIDITTAMKPNYQLYSLRLTPNSEQHYSCYLRVVRYVVVAA